MREFFDEAKGLFVAGAVFVMAALILYFMPGIGVNTYSLGCLILFAVPFMIGLVQTVQYVKSLARQVR